MRARQARRSRRGMTLLEAVFAVLVLATGVAALMGMIINVENANRSMALQHASLDVFARISAQIRDAECDFVTGQGLTLATTDPSFLPGGLPNFGANGQWITAPGVTGSSITLVGDGTTNPELADYVPPIRVAYQVQLENNPAATPAFQVNVQVRQIMDDPQQDLLTNTAGYWVRMYPVQKLCNARGDATQRGEY